MDSTICPQYSAPSTFFGWLKFRKLLAILMITNHLAFPAPLVKGFGRPSLMTFSTLPTALSLQRLFNVLLWIAILQALPTALAASVPSLIQTTTEPPLKAMATKEVCPPCPPGISYAQILGTVLTVFTISVLFRRIIDRPRLRAVLFLLQLTQLPMAAAMERQPRGLQAFIPERVEGDVRWINRNGFFSLILAMWVLGIIYEFLGLFSTGINLLVLFLPLAFSLHSFNNALFPGQGALTDNSSASTLWSKWVPVLSIFVFIYCAITNRSRVKFHFAVCVITVLLGLAQNMLKNLQSQLPLWLVQMVHFFIVATHFNIWYSTFVMVRHEAGN
jgi:hypothetical protein